MNVLKKRDTKCHEWGKEKEEEIVNSVKSKKMCQRHKTDRYHRMVESWKVSLEMVSCNLLAQTRIS